MTQKQKELLLKDLCARLPYGLLVKTPDHYSPQVVNSISDNLEVVVQKNLGYSLLFEAKAYLRPMSSMTKEEKEFILRCAYGGNHIPADEIDFYNANHFDYRGLIPMGLALEAPEGMYK